MLDLNEIAMFVQVVHSGSFAEAARKLGMPANSLSRHVNRLEEQLGARLLHRSTRKLMLTDAGYALHERSAQQVAELLEAAEDVTRASETASGVIRVATPADFFDFFEIDWVSEFLTAHPRVSIEFVLDDAKTDLIAQGIDIAFRGGEPTTLSLVARMIGKERMTMAASPAYLQVNGVPKTIDALGQHDCIRAIARNRTIWRLDGPSGPTEVEVSGRFTANTVQAQLRAAIAGLGICLLPGTILHRSLLTGVLDAVLPEYGQNLGGFHLIYPSGKRSSRAVKAFVQLVIRHLGEGTNI